MAKIYESPDGGKTVYEREFGLTREESEALMNGCVSVDFSPRVDYQRNEGNLIEEVRAYIDSTYSAHYSGKVQVLDVWDSMGLSKDAYRTNIVKYAMRAGRKGDQERKDVMKIIHYALFLLNEIDKENDSHRK